MFVQHGLPGDYECWDIALTGGSWNSLPAPPHRLWLSTSAAVGDKFVLVGGSKTVEEMVEKMVGTKLVQEYNPASRTWSLGPQLPHHLFESCARAQHCSNSLLLSQMG